ncbi:hypothetical protein XENOCAPTIV_018639, partial [Xenoophorus captivus]
TTKPSRTCCMAATLVTRRRWWSWPVAQQCEQLRALESYFAQKHNPDGKDWTCLAHKTGLPKRVLQVWFQNARAKLRRSLNSEDSQSDSNSVPPGAVTLAASPSSLACSQLGQSQPFPTSTIDQLQLSLLTGPVGEPSVSPILNQSCQMLQSPNFFLDYNPQSAFSCIPSLEPHQEFGEAEGKIEREADDENFRPNYN